MTPEAEAKIVEGYRAGRPLAEIAAEVGYCPHYVAQTATRLRKRGVGIPRRYGKRGIPLAPFQERWAELSAQGVTYADVARKLGWYARGCADGGRVSRVLGLRAHQDTHGKRTRSTITYDTAECLCDAMGLERWEVGL